MKYLISGCKVLFAIIAIILMMAILSYAILGIIIVVMLAATGQWLLFTGALILLIFCLGVCAQVSDREDSGIY